MNNINTFQSCNSQSNNGIYCNSKRMKAKLF